MVKVGVKCTRMANYGDETGLRLLLTVNGLSPCVFELCGGVTPKFSFPLRLVLIEHENLGSNFATDVKILGHVNLMKVAGKQTEIFLEQMVVRKVRTQVYDSRRVCQLCTIKLTVF